MNDLEAAADLLAKIEAVEERHKDVNKRVKDLVEEGTRKCLIVRWSEFPFGTTPVGFSGMKLQELRDTYTQALDHFNEDTSRTLQAIALEAKRRVVANKLDITPLARFPADNYPFGEAGRLLEDALWKIAHRWADLTTVVRNAVQVREMVDRIDLLEEFSPNTPEEEESKQLLIKEARAALEYMLHNLPRKEDLPSMHLSMHTLTDFLGAHPKVAEFAAEKQKTQKN